MTTARDVMHLGAQCVDEDETLTEAAVRMRDLNVGALPVCGADDRLHGIITDRDIAVRCVADGFDPETMTAGELARAALVWVDIEDSEDEVIRVMTESGVRRVPVLDDSRLVGMISEADLATHLDDHRLKQFAEALYSGPPTN
jgi:CBS domain-containing protein